MQSVLRTSQCKWQEGLQILLLLGLSGAGLPGMASELCALNFQAAERGEWALLQKAGDYFVFRTHRKQLDPTTINDIASYYDVAEDAALQALESHASRNLPGTEKNGTLLVSRSQAQRILCDGRQWTVFSYNLANVSWKKPESTPPTKALVTSATPIQASPMAANATPNAVVPTAAKPAVALIPRKAEPRTLTTVED